MLLVTLSCGLITTTFVGGDGRPLVERLARMVKLKSFVERFSTARYQSPLRSDRKPLVSTRIWAGLLVEPGALNKGGEAGSGKAPRTASKSAGLFRLYSENATAEFV